MRFLLILGLLAVPALVAAQDSPKTFGDWDVVREVDVMTDEVTVSAKTALRDVDDAKFWRDIVHDFVVMCSDLPTPGYTSFLITAFVPGIHQPTDEGASSYKVRFRVHKQPASESTTWSGIEVRESDFTVLIMPRLLASSFMRQAHAADNTVTTVRPDLLLEVNEVVFRYSLKGFTAATSELPCTSW